MKITINVEGVPFPTQTVEILDIDEILLLLHDAKQITFGDAFGEAHKKGKAVYLAGLRRGIKLTLRYGTRVENKVYSVTLAMPGILDKTKRGRPSKKDFPL